MRHRTLAPPREIWHPEVAGRRPASRLDRAPLPAPHAAWPRRRRLFDPVAGWFRRLERRLSRELSQRVFPHVPGMAIPYDWQLRRRLTVSEAEVTLRNLPASLEGVRLLLLTDLHSGPFLSPTTIEFTFRRLRSLRPDAVLLGGDLATNTLEEVRRCGRVLSSVEAPMGTFAVLGNHDHYTGDATELRRLLEESGVQVLHNRAVRLSRGDGRLLLAGIDDYNAGTPDLARALTCADAGGPVEGAPAPRILLSHNPDVFFEAAERGVDLVLSGHTHGGQVRVPGLPVLVRMSRFRLDQGRYAYRDAELVVSRGIGVCGLPLRVHCPPEVVLITLRRTSGAHHSGYLS